MPSSAQQSEMRPGPELLTIGALSRETGIPVPTLRTWERRYGQPSPLRRPSGHRLYPAEWIERLRKVEFLLQQGHRAANVLVMSLPQLEALVAMSQARQITPRYVPAAHTDEDAERVISRLMRATQRIEREVLMGELRLEWARLGPLRFLSEVAAPFMAEVGDAWRRGEIEVRHEHFAAITPRAARAWSPRPCRGTSTTSVCSWPHSCWRCAGAACCIWARTCPSRTRCAPR
ncbi:MAG: hypothetical protein RL721_2385 [Candidatus Eisenbacteria bacterium]